MNEGTREEGAVFFSAYSFDALLDVVGRDRSLSFRVSLSFGLVFIILTCLWYLSFRHSSTKVFNSYTAQPCKFTLSPHKM